MNRLSLQCHEQRANTASGYMNPQYSVFLSPILWYFQTLSLPQERGGLCH